MHKNGKYKNMYDCMSIDHTMYAQTEKVHSAQEMSEHSRTICCIVNGQCYPFKRYEWVNFEYSIGILEMKT